MTPSSTSPAIARRRLEIAAELLAARREEAKAAGLSDAEIVAAEAHASTPTKEPATVAGVITSPASLEHMRRVPDGYAGPCVLLVGQTDPAENGAYIFMPIDEEPTT